MLRLRGIILLWTFGWGFSFLFAGGPAALGQEKEKATGHQRLQDETAKAAAPAAGAKAEANPHPNARPEMTPEEAAVAAGMRTRVYHLPGWGEYPRDEVKEGQSVICEALKDQGIPFPKGAAAFYNEETKHLIVTNTLENLAQVQQMVSNFYRAEVAVVCAVTVVEGPGELIRQAQAAALEKGDAAPALATLLGYARAAGAKVRVVGECVVESISEKKAKAEAVCEFAFPKPLKLDAGSRVSEVPWETRQVGLRLEVETEVGADLRSLDTRLRLELHSEPPRVEQARVTDPATGHAAEFPLAEVNAVVFSTELSVATGATRLIGIARPGGAGAAAAGDDRLWAAFATFTTRPPANAARLLEPAETALPAGAPPPPPGMVTVLFQVPQGLGAPWRADARPDKPAPPLPEWLAGKGVAFPPGASVTHEQDVLRVTNTPENIGRVVAQLETVLSSTDRTAAFTVHAFQAPAAFLRDLARRTTATADDAAMLAAVEEAVARGEARCIDSLMVETTRNNTAIHEAGYQHSYLETFSSNAKGRPMLELGRRHVGSFFSAEVTQQDHGSATFEYLYELHTAPPSVRRLRFQDPGTEKAFELPVTDFHVARAQGSLRVASGGTRLLALHAPVGRAAAEPALLCATFLRMDTVPQASRFTQQAIAEAEKKHAAAADKLRADPHSWETRSFHVPPDFTVVSGRDEVGGRLREVFIGAGVAFPEGAVVSYNPATSTVFLKNTRENLAIAEAFVRSIVLTQPATLPISAQVLEGPAPLLRKLAAQAAAKNDHRAELDTLLAAAKEGRVRQAGMLHVEGKSGTRATSGDGSEQPYLAGVTTDDKGATVFEQDIHYGGFRLELEPTIGADGCVAGITLTADHANAGPVQHVGKIVDTRGRTLEFPLTDHHRARTHTTTCIPHHHARLIHLWRPTGKPELEKEDVLQVLFITCDIMRDGSPQ